MGLKYTTALMNSADYRDRFKAEYYQLDIRMKKIERIVNDYNAGLLKFTPSCPIKLLERQLEAMKVYAQILRERAEIEEIDL